MTMVKVRDLSVREIIGEQTGYKKKAHEMGFVNTTRIETPPNGWHGTVDKDGKIRVK